MGASGWGLREVPEEQRVRYRNAGWWTDETLGERLAARLEEHRDRPFVVHSATRPWRGTFGDVLDLARRVAGGLVERGVSPGDAVSFQTPNWLEGAATFYGAALAGAVVVPIVHIYGSHELSYVLGACEPRVHVTAARFGRQDYLANLEALAPLLPDQILGADQVFVVGEEGAGPFRPFEDLLTATPIAQPIDADPTTPAMVGWTSGTTSNPKGVVHSHQTALAEVRQLTERMPPGYRPTLMANPISHAIGMLGGLLLPVEAGRAVHLLDQWDPAVVLKLMIEEDLSAGGGVPFFLTSLLDHPDFTDEHLSRLTYQGMGGAPIPQAVADRATSLGIVMWRSYGSTEHPSMTGSAYDDQPEKRLHTDGAVMPGTELRLLDPDGSEVAIGEPGEIVARGPEQFIGYTDPALTAKVFDGEGWYHSGDIAVVDGDGYFTITDRISDVIIRGGENISAAEVEELLMLVPGVAEVAVVAAPDARMGEHAAAVVRLIPDHEEPSLASIGEYLERSGLARQKWPEEIVVVDDFPRTASGKIQKFRLREQLRHRSAAGN